MSVLSVPTGCTALHAWCGHYRVVTAGHGRCSAVGSIIIVMIIIIQSAVHLLSGEILY